jgi:hypothetical protein
MTSIRPIFAIVFDTPLLIAEARFALIANQNAAEIRSVVSATIITSQLSA